MDEQIELSKGDFIAEGIYCKCYEHPSNKNQCIKILVEGKKARQRLKEDINYYSKLHKRQVSLEYIANYIGESETSLGKGFIYECIRDYDGAVSKRLQHYLDTEELDAEVLYKKMKELGHYLLSNKILISDLHARNVLIQVSESGGIKPMIVDGIGDRVAITILNMLPGAVESKVKRRWNRFAQKELKGNTVIE